MFRRPADAGRGAGPTSRGELRAESAGNVRAMDIETAVHQTHGDAPEPPDSIDANGPATEHSEEGRPLRIPIIEVAFGKGMWWSSNGQVRLHARGMLPSRHCYRAYHLRVQLCYSFTQALLQSKL